MAAAGNVPRGDGSRLPVPVVREPADRKINIALSNSFGFGGANASLIFRRWS